MKCKRCRCVICTTGAAGAEKPRVRGRAGCLTARRRVPVASEVRFRVRSAMLDQPIARFENLRVEFETKDGTVVGVEDVSFSIGPGETVCVVGESGVGKVGLVAVAHAACGVRGRAYRGRAHPVRPGAGRGADGRGEGERQPDAHDPRQRDRDDLPGAHDLAQPGVHGGAAADRAYPGAQGPVEGGGRGAGAGAAAAGAESPSPSGGWRSIRTSCRGACGSGWSSPSRWPASRGS